MSCLYLYLLQLCARKLRCQPQPLNTLYSRDILSLPTSEKAVVVQWSAHPTWYPKLLSALPDNLIYSLSRVGRSLVRIQPMTLVISFWSWIVLCCVDIILRLNGSVSLCHGVMLHDLYTPFHDIFITWSAFFLVPLTSPRYLNSARERWSKALHIYHQHNFNSPNFAK